MPNLAIASALESHCGPSCGPNGGPNSGPNGGPNGGPSCGPNGCAGLIHNMGHNLEILYIGSRARMDRGLVEAAGIKFKAIFAGKFRRYFAWQNFIDPFFVIVGFFQSLWILICFWPDVVFSKGGFVSLPVVFAAFILRRPIILHEADSVMGLANRIAAKFADKICISFPNINHNNLTHAKRVHNLANNLGHYSGHNLSHNPKYIFTGNPIRTEIKNGNPEEGYRITGLRAGRPIVLVWGGSQGAQEINDMIAREFHHLKHTFQIIHIAGKGKRTAIADPNYIQYEYLGDELKHIYAITDIVVGRGGANSLYELAFMRKPNIIIPIQNQDQINNAEYFESEGAGIVLRDQLLHEVLSALWHNPYKMAAMKEALSRIARPEAAQFIAQILISKS